MSNQTYVNYYERGSSESKHAQALTALIGLVFNTLSICVFEKKQLKKHSYSNYWKAKALFENIILLQVIIHWIGYFYKLDVDLISTFFCRFNQYQPYVAGGFSLWLETVIILDRFFSIVYPNRFKFIKTIRFQIAVFFIIGVYSLIINLNLLVNLRLDVKTGSNNTWICHASLNALKISSIIGLLNTLAVNILINPVLDLIIICYITNTRNNNIRRLNRSSIIDRKFAISAIALNMSSLLLKLPFQTVVLISNVLRLKNDEISILYSVGLCMLLIDKSDIFFINILVNSVFRRQFLLMFGIDSTDKKANQIRIANGSNNSNNIRTTPLLDDYCDQAT